LFSPVVGFIPFFVLISGNNQRATLFDGAEIDLLFQTSAYDRHHVGERAAQVGDFRYDERIASFHLPQQHAEFPIVFVFPAAGNLHDPIIDRSVSVLGEAPDFILSVSRMLFPCAYP